MRRIVNRIDEVQRRALLALARGAVDRELAGSSPPPIPALLAELTEARAAFVTVRDGENRLRGCRGEIPARRSLPECVRAVAVSAALDDPRFPPVTVAELADVWFEISVLSEARALEPEEIEVGRHGLLLRSEAGSGLLLPQAAAGAGWGRDEYLAGVCLKAGLEPGAWRRPDVELLAFEAEVWSERETACGPRTGQRAPHG